MFHADALFPFNAKMAEHSKEHDLVALQIVDTTFVIHGTPGAALPESIYQQMLCP